MKKMFREILDIFKNLGAAVIKAMKATMKDWIEMDVHETRIGESDIEAISR